MSNVKSIVISGTLPFDCAEVNEEIKDWLASMNTPCFGLRITWSREPCEMRPNDHGGRTAFYHFSIQGREAVSYSAIERLITAIQSVGTAGTVTANQVVED